MVLKSQRRKKNFDGSNILIGVTGGIAAYKVCNLIRELVKFGAEVKVIMTEAATRFITPLTLSTLSKNPVYTDKDFWNADGCKDSKNPTIHISLAEWADVILIAPASANTIAKLACGMCDNLLTAVALAARCPVAVAPTMDVGMYLNESTQANLVNLKEMGYFVIQPAEGELASGITGIGRLPEISVIVEALKNILLGITRDLVRRKILVTAGPTYESIDAVRFIGNRSSGKMGFAIANAAVQRGAEVLLVTGPSNLRTPNNVNRINVESTLDMFKAVKVNYKKADVLIMAAAVADFRPEKIEFDKIKKENKNMLELKLVPTVDILFEMGKLKKRKKIHVGFALETNEDIQEAKRKLREKKLDFIVFNSFSKENNVFGSDFNEVTIIDSKGNIEKLPRMPKFDVANKVLDKIVSIL